MDFSTALEQLKDGYGLTRKAWIDTTFGASPNAALLLKTVRWPEDRRKPYEFGVPFVVAMTAMTIPPFNTQGTDRKVNDRTAQWIGEDKPLQSGAYLAHYDPSTNQWQPGWLPQAVDIFADDWVSL